MKVGFISGTSILHSRLFDHWESTLIETKYGRVTVRRRESFAIINRHGCRGLTPPHAINHRANIQAFADLGFEDIVAVSSVGSLREDLPPGTVVSCSDYVSFHPATFDDETGNYEAPFVSNNLIPCIRESAGVPIETGAVYVQTRGPRFETRAEVRIIRHWGDVVGMTLASEADLAREAGLRYNSLCVVDNYANGIRDEAVTGERFHKQVAENRRTVDTLFQRLFAILGAQE